MGGHPGERAVPGEIVVRAGVDRMWEAWSTENGARSSFAPDCRIALEPGGACEKWDQTFDYNGRVWTKLILPRLAYRFEHGQADDPASPDASPGADRGAGHHRLRWRYLRRRGWQGLRLESRPKQPSDWSGA